MNTKFKLQFIVVLAIGAAIGYAVASSGSAVPVQSIAAQSASPKLPRHCYAEQRRGAPAAQPVCLTEEMSKSRLIAMTDSETPAAGENSAAAAPVVTGVLGSPSATTTISGKQLPPPDPKFGGVIKENAVAVESRGGRRASCRPRARRTCC